MANTDQKKDDEGTVKKEVQEVQYSCNGKKRMADVEYLLRYGVPGKEGGHAPSFSMVLVTIVCFLVSLLIFSIAPHGKSKTAQKRAEKKIREKEWLEARRARYRAQEDASALNVDLGEDL